MNKVQSYILYGIAVLAVFTVLCVRLSADRGQEPLMQADGAVFLSDALFHSLPYNLMTTYDGTLYTLSRCAAQPASIENLSGIARYFRVISLFIASMVIAMPLLPLFLRRIPLTVRLLVVGLVTLLPWEVVALGNLTGLSCFMFCVIAMMTLGDYSRAGHMELILSGTVFVLAVLSTSFSGIALPIIVWRYFRRDDMRTKTVFGGMLFLVIVQQVFLLFMLVSQGSGLGPPSFPGALLSVVRAFGYNVVCMTAMGQEWTRSHGRSWLVCYVAWILFFLFSALCCRLYQTVPSGRREKTNFRLMMGASLYYIISPLMFRALIRSARFRDFILMELFPAGDCSCFVSTCFALIMMSLNLYILLKRYRNIAVKCILIFLLCAYAVILQRNFFYEPAGDGGWGQAVEQYRRDLADGMSGYDDYRIRLNNRASAIIRLPLLREESRVREQNETNVYE